MPNAALFEDKWRWLERRFKARPLLEEGLNDMYLELEEIPDEAWRQITRSFYYEKRTIMPSPGEFKSEWFQWREANRKPASLPPGEECWECQSSGLLVAIRFPPRIWPHLARHAGDLRQLDLEVTWIHQRHPLTADERKEGFGYEGGFVCGSCRNWEHTGHSLFWYEGHSQTRKYYLAKRTRAELAADGYYITQPSDWALELEAQAIAGERKIPIDRRTGQPPRGGDAVPLKDVVEKLPF